MEHIFDKLASETTRHILSFLPFSNVWKASKTCKQVYEMSPDLYQYYPLQITYETTWTELLQLASCVETTKIVLSKIQICYGSFYILMTSNPGGILIMKNMIQTCLRRNPSFVVDFGDYVSDIHCTYLLALGDCVRYKSGAIYITKVKSEMKLSPNLERLFLRVSSIELTPVGLNFRAEDAEKVVNIRKKWLTIKIVINILHIFSPDDIILVKDFVEKYDFTMNIFRIDSTWREKTIPRSILPRGVCTVFSNGYALTILEDK